MLRRCETIALSDCDRLDLRQFEGQRCADVALLRRCLADEELPRLAVMVGEALRPHPNLLAFLGFRETSENPGAGFPRAADFVGPS
jgi:hypothetical protein